MSSIFYFLFKVVLQIILRQQLIVLFISGLILEVQYCWNLKDVNTLLKTLEFWNVRKMYKCEKSVNSEQFVPMTGWSVFTGHTLHKFFLLVCLNYDIWISLEACCRRRDPNQSIMTGNVCTLLHFIQAHEAALLTKHRILR